MTYMQQHGSLDGVSEPLKALNDPLALIGLLVGALQRQHHDACNDDRGDTDRHDGDDARKIIWGILLAEDE